MDQWPGHRIIPLLLSFLCHEDKIVKWRAVTAIGFTVAKLARQDLERARSIMDRLVWSLNSESGSIGWGAPEALGEIMALDEGLARDYANILVSYIRDEENFLHNEELERGVVWGLGRLAQVRPYLVQDAVPGLSLQ